MSPFGRNVEVVLKVIARSSANLPTDIDMEILTLL